MSKEEIWNSFLQVFSKTIVPSIITVTIGVAVEYRRTKKLSWIQVLLSFIIGLGTAYLAHEWIHETYPNVGQATIAVSFITMASSKGWELLMVFVNKTKLSDVIEWISKFYK